MGRYEKMFQYTIDNHFKFGYNKNWFVNRINEDDQWSVLYGQTNRVVHNWREECKIAAKNIYDNRQGLSIDILFSGGIDSEIALRSFLEIKVPVNVHFAVYEDDKNAYDYHYVKQACNELDLKLKEHKLDVKKFWQSDECLRYAKISKSVSPQILPQMWLMDQVDGLPIMGSAECYTARSDIAEQKRITPENRIYDNRNWVFVEREKIASWYRYPMHTNRPAIPGFFQYTPEIMISYLTDDISLNLHNNRLKGKLSNASSKFKICKNYWPELSKRDKHSGFEYLIDEDIVLRKNLKEINGMFEYEYWSDVFELVDYMTCKTNEMPKNLSKPIKDPCDCYTTYFKTLFEKGNK